MIRWFRSSLLMLMAGLGVTNAAFALEGVGQADGSGPLQFPSLIRVAAGFVITVGLMIGAAWLLRWKLARNSNSPGSPGTLQVQFRSTPVPGLVLTVIAIGRRQILVTESRHGVHTLLLPQDAGEGGPDA